VRRAVAAEIANEWTDIREALTKPRTRSTSSALKADRRGEVRLRRVVSVSPAGRRAGGESARVLIEVKTLAADAARARLAIDEAGTRGGGGLKTR
jgi:hypothetical protein